MKTTIDAMKQLRAALDPDDWVGEITMHAFIDRIIAREEAQTDDPVAQIVDCEKSTDDDGNELHYALVYALPNTGKILPVGTKLFTHPEPAAEPVKPSAGEREALIYRSQEMAKAMTAYGYAGCAALCLEASDMLAADAQTVPDGYALVPIKMTRAMIDIADQEDWRWADILAEAEAITEYQYNEAMAQQVAVPQVLPKIEVTEAMHRAAVKVLHRAHGLDGLPQRMMDAMLAVAPQPPQADEPCHCDKQGIGKPGVTCGDCPRDYLPKDDAPRVPMTDDQIDDSLPDAIAFCAFDTPWTEKAKDVMRSTARAVEKFHGIGVNP